MANMTFGVNLIPHNNTPSGNNTYSLGNSDNQWKLWASELNGQPLANTNSLYYVEGPSTDTTIGVWTGTIEGLTEYYDGLTVIYVPAVAGGWADACGKNKLNPNLLNGYYDTTTGVLTSASNWRASEQMPCKPSTSYIMSGSSYSTGGYSGAALFWNKYGNYIGSVGTSQPFTSPANAATMAIYTGASTVTSSMQIEEGTTATTYVPYAFIEPIVGEVTIPAVLLNTAVRATLNINNLGAIPCYGYGDSPLPDSCIPNMPILFTYKDGVWRQTDSYTLTEEDKEQIAALVGAMDIELPPAYRRLNGLTFAGSTYYETSFKLKGSDTVRFSMSAITACNVFGCYTTTSATDNYSLYITTTDGGKYLRYNGGTYKSYWASGSMGKRYNIIITPTGSSGMPTNQNDTWSATTFTASANMCIGTTSTSASSTKFTGNIYGNFIVDGRFKGIPCERLSDGVLGYYDTYSSTFYTPVGSAPASLGYDMSQLKSGKLIAATTLNNDYTLTITYTDGTTYTTGSIRGANGSDSNIVMVHATCSTSSISSANWTVDKTFQELYDAYQSGKTLLLYVRRTYSSAKMAALLYIDGYTAPSTSSIAFSGLKSYPDNSNSGNCIQKLKFIISSTDSYTYTAYDIADKTPGAVASNYIGEYGSSSFYFGLDANDNLALFAVAEVYTLADLYNDFGSTMAQRPITKLILYGWIDEQIDTYPYRVNYNAYQCDGLDWYQFYDENTTETTDRYRVVFSTRYLDATTQQSIIRVLVAEGDGTEDLCSDGLPFTVHDIQDGSPGRGIAAINETSSSGGVDTYTITYTDNTTSTFTVTNGVDYVLTSQDKQDIISELAEEFTDDTGWEDLSSYIKPSLVTCNSCLFRRIGNVVYIKFDFSLKGTLNTSTWLTINQTSSNVAIPLPEQWRPTNTIFIYGCSQTPGAYFRITYDGYIAIRNQTGEQVKGTDAGGSWWITASGNSYFVSSGILPSGLTEVTVSGTTPTIVAESNTRYLCGTVLSLDFTPPATGITDVMFTTGSTLPVITFPNTVKFPDWYEIEINKTYEINILNGVYAVVAEWEAT